MTGIRVWGPLVGIVVATCAATITAFQVLMRMYGVIAAGTILFVAGLLMAAVFRLAVRGERA